MIRHRIYVRHSGVKADDRLSIPLIKHCVREVLDHENVDAACEISVLITDDRGIREINRKFRVIDEPTDVLSFPMHDFSTPGWANPGQDASRMEAEPLLLGDIVLSAERVEKQARQFKNSREHETAYLTVHSVLHLLGYDHMDEAEEKKVMRAREKEIMKKITRLEIVEA